MIQEKNTKYNNPEFWIFFIFACINASILFVNPHFVSLDGPSHLYNTTLIKELLNPNSQLHTYYQLNHELLPNWFGHFIILSFKLIFNAGNADKLFLVLYVVLFPFSFRYLITQISKKNTLVSFLIFPFVYTFPFILGFYNFCFSLVWLFYSLGFYLKHINALDKKRFIILSILLILCYFSHLFSFISALLSLSIINIYFSLIKKTVLISFSNLIKGLFKNQLYLFGASIIPICLTGLYLYHRKDLEPNPTFLPTTKLLEELKQLRVLIMYSVENEMKYVAKISYLFYILVIITLYLMFERVQFSLEFFKKTCETKKLVWFILLLFFIVLYFKIPDSDGYAGYFSIRLSLLVYIISIIILSLITINKKVLIGCIIMVLIIHSFRLKSIYLVQKNLNSIVNELAIIEQSIPVYASVYTINRSDNWLFLHINNYLGENKPLMLLENYEANNSYFPVQWNKTNMPNWYLDDKELAIFEKSNNEKKQVDFVLLSINSEIFKNIDKKEFEFIKQYHAESATSNFILFKRLPQL